MDKIAFMIKNAVVEQPLDDLVEETLKKLFGTPEENDEVSIDALIQRAQNKMRGTTLLNQFTIAKDAVRGAESAHLYFCDLQHKEDDASEHAYEMKRAELASKALNALYIDNRIALYQHYQDCIKNLKENSLLLQEVLMYPDKYPGINRLINIDETKKRLKELVNED